MNFRICHQTNEIKWTSFYNIDQLATFEMKGVNKCHGILYKPFNLRLSIVPNNDHRPGELMLKIPNHLLDRYLGKTASWRSWLALGCRARQSGRREECWSRWCGSARWWTSSSPWRTAAPASGNPLGRRRWESRRRRPAHQIPASFFVCDQCDQMARLIYQNLAICNKQNCPIAQKCAKIGSKCYQMLSRPSKQWPKTLKSLQKWRNFAKFGHTAIWSISLQNLFDVPHLYHTKFSKRFSLTKAEKFGWGPNT